MRGHHHIKTGLLGRCLGVSGEGHFRLAVDGPGHVVVVDRHGVLTQNVTDHADTFGEAHMSQLWGGDAVTDGPHAVHGRSTGVVHCDEPPIVEFDAGALGQQRIGVGPPTHRDDHHVALDALAIAEVDRGTARPVGAVPADLHPCPNSDLLLLERPQNLLGNILVQAGKDLGHRLEDGDLGTHVGHRGRKLAADGAAANHNRTAWQIGKLEKFV